MRRYFALLPMLVAVFAAFAIPAKRGIWKTLPFGDTTVRAQLIGDEHAHYWLTDDGLQLVEQDGRFVAAEMSLLRSNAMKRRAQRKAAHMPRKAIGDFMHYTGSKKGLIVLVEFTNQKFSASNDSLLYTRICNETGFSEGRFRGSVNDYFKAQSYGEFNLTFDIAGPVLMDTTYQYFGQDLGGQGNDAHPGQMVAWACQAVDPYVNFADYDWDGDGRVDQVMCIYAGQGQADGGSAQTIWPHEWQLDESDWGEELMLDGVAINTYAVANERTSSGIEGIGTICHEFSHCLGLPDMYDVLYGGNYGMGEWSLMDQGSYNGNGFCPSGYSSFDKLTCGWVKPTELERNVTIEAMQPLEDKPEVYMVRNEAYDNEYFLLENRQRKGWDAELPGDGMLILYVDYDRTIWEWNLVNTDNNDTSGGFPRNDHQRCTVMQAGGSGGGYWHDSSNDTYPCNANDSLTNTSSPAAVLHHNNTDGSRLLNKGIMDIRRNGNGTMAFRFRNTPQEVYLPEGTVFYESFDNCMGTGANDGEWTVNMASSVLVTDNQGWTVNKGYGGYHCARFGNGANIGSATTPAFALPTGDAILSFRAAGWNQDGTTLTVTAEAADGTPVSVEPQEVEMASFAWTDYSLHLRGKGDIRITFTPEHRFLLDNVLVVERQEAETEGVETISGNTGKLRYYTIDGRPTTANRPGLYIVAGEQGGKARIVRR